MGPQNQPDFVNAAAAISTNLEPHTLLKELLRIELEAGRNREGVEHWGPRMLDLDLLVYADRVIDSQDLTVPHPGIQQRAFVVVPLFDIAPELVIPGVGAVSELAKGFQGHDLQPLSGNE